MYLCIFQASFTNKAACFFGPLPPHLHRPPGPSAGVSMLPYVLPAGSTESCCPSPCSPPHLRICWFLPFYNICNTGEKIRCPQFPAIQFPALLFVKVESAASSLKSTLICRFLQSAMWSLFSLTGRIVSYTARLRKYLSVLIAALIEQDAAISSLYCLILIRIWRRWILSSFYWLLIKSTLRFHLFIS